MATDDAEPVPPVLALTRWERSGGAWRVCGRGPAGLTISLLTCDGGQEMERITSGEPALLAFVGDRESSED